MDDYTDDLPVDSILEPKSLLRLVDRDNVEYFELRDSIRDHGFLNSICVRPATSEPDKYEIIDGLYRVTCAKELGLSTVPCLIKHHVNDDELLALQIQANAVRPETTPTDFARQMKILLTRQPDMSLGKLSMIVGKSPKWVSDRLGLIRLTKTMQLAVDRGQIPLQSAYMLAKMPYRFQRQHFQDACEMPTKEFRILATGVIKGVMESARQGKLDAFFVSEFEPQHHLRDLKTIKQECASRLVSGMVLTSMDCKTAVDGFYAALQWVMHMDPYSVKEQLAAYERRQRNAELSQTLDI